MSLFGDFITSTISATVGFFICYSELMITWGLFGNQYSTYRRILQFAFDASVKLKRFAKNLKHRFSRNAVLRSILARVPRLTDISG
jgi:hypothetical protein